MNFLVGGNKSGSFGRSGKDKVLLRKRRFEKPKKDPLHRLTGKKKKKKKNNSKQQQRSGSKKKSLVQKVECEKKIPKKPVKNGKSEIIQGGRGGSIGEGK